MKKFSLTVFVLTVFAIQGMAQFNLNVIGGPQLTTFGGEEKKEWGGTNENPSMVVRYQIGLLAERMHNERLAFMFGLLLSTKGASYSGDFVDFNTQQNVQVKYVKKLMYLDLPLLLRYRASEKWSFLFGPQLSFLLSAKIKNDENAQNLFDVPETEDAKDYYTKFDVGVNLGTIYMLNERLALMLLYQYGLLKIGIDETYDNNGGTTEKKYAIMNRMLALSLLYTFKQQ